MSKHYIYEIFGQKIGATTDVKRRMKQQGAKEGEYRIIEEHTNAKICSIREIELQKEYNYPVDRIQYWKTLKIQKKSYTLQARKKAVANTDYKAFQAKRIANTDWESHSAKIDWKASRAKIDFSEYKMTQCHTPEALIKRVANTNFKAIGNKIKKPVNQSDLKDNFIKRWDSAIDAAREFFNDRNCQSNITACCKGKQKTHKNYKWNYANK
jgi:hypothetical protein